MGLGHSPRIITENLVLLLDAANPRNFDLTKVEVLVVAGGGSGGVDNGGGGGAGGLIYNSNFAVTPGTQLTATVGDGGAARVGASDDGPGNNGANSVFGSLTSYGGGGGSGWVNATLPPGSSSYTGGNGAGQSASTGSVNSLGAGTGNRITGTTSVASGQGNNGGTAVGAFAGGGGGGGGSGGNASNGAAGAGGLGFRSNISGSQAIYAAGGAGGWDVFSGYSSVLPFTENGTVKKTTQTAEDACPANTGHGGNGGNHNNNSSGAGGSGIIIVRYQGPQKAIGGVVTSVNGDTIHTFTTSGNFTPLVNTNNSAVLGLSDLSGNRNFGDSGGSGVLYSSANGGSLSFDATNDYVTTSLVTSLSNNVTISSWFRTFNASQAGQMVIFNGSDANGNGYGFAVNNEATTNGEILLLYSAIAWINTGFFAASNVIYNATMVIESDNSNKLYINGNLVHSGISRTINTPTNHTEIGRNDYPAARYFNGNIAQVSIYNRALTAQEISQNFNALRGRFGI